MRMIFGPACEEWRIRKNWQFRELNTEPDVVTKAKIRRSEAKLHGRGTCSQIVGGHEIDVSGNRRLPGSTRME